LYAYAANNPVRYIDPEGNYILPAVIVILIGTMRPKHQRGGYKYFDNKQPQRVGGYYKFYENFTSNNIVCNIDSLRTDFTNSKGEESSIWLWKGNYNMVFDYGWHVGAEVGAYGSLGEADDSMFQAVNFILTNKKEGTSVGRTVIGQYWVNRFDKGICTPSDLVLTANIYFNNEEDADAYCKAVNEGVGKNKPNTYFNSVDRNEQVNLSASKIGRIVTVTFE